MTGKITRNSQRLSGQQEVLTSACTLDGNYPLGVTGKPTGQHLLASLNSPHRTMERIRPDNMVGQQHNMDLIAHITGVAMVIEQHI